MSNLEGFSGGADYANDVHIKLLTSLSISQYCMYGITFLGLGLCD